MNNLGKWLKLNKIPGLGKVGIKKLWDQYGSIDAIWQSDLEILSQKDTINIDQELAAIGDNKYLTFDDNKYPKLLQNIYDPPLILYYCGELMDLNAPSIAMVGTRKATRYGLSMAHKLAKELAGLGFTIVSGMALGIDTAAHKGALEAKGKTVAVLGCGANMIYPVSNRGLYTDILKTGTILSEYLPGTEPDNFRFPQRNRIISGIATGVIVVEGHYDSGAMITAKLALEQGREVFAVPGNIELEQSKGPHWLIKQGAKLVESVEDILEEIKHQIPSTKLQTNSNNQISNNINMEQLSEDEKKIIKILSREPKHVDLVAQETGMEISQVLTILMQLEIKQVVRQQAFKNFALY